jgi:uncharacterized protein YggE
MEHHQFTPAHAILVAVLIGGGFYVYGKHLDRSPTPVAPGTITVTGEGKIAVSPDLAEMSFGVTTGVQATAKAASDKVAADMAKILAAVKAAGVEDKDITTENFYLNPSYDYNDGRQRLRGYEATQSLRVKVRDLDAVGDVLTAATDNGANQAGGVSFTLEDPDAKKDEARTEAIADAKKKAEELAAQLGQELGDVQSFSENGGGWYPPVYMARDAYGTGGASPESAMADGKAVMPAGDQDLTVNVTITYELR